MVDNKGQTSAEFILLVGGIIVVVLLTLMFYRNYITGLSGEIKGEEVSNFNGKLDSLSEYFTLIICGIDQIIIIATKQEAIIAGG